MYDVSTTKVFVSYKTEKYRERFGFYTAGVRAAFKPMRTQTLMNLKMVARLTLGRPREPSR